MHLKDIDKARYRKHLNIVIIASIAMLVVGSLSLSQLLIMLFPDGDGSHFHWNLTGVVATAILIGWLLNKFRNHPFMTEVTYIWELKQVLNQVTRKLQKLKNAAQQGDVRAMNALQFSYSGSRLLWQLDDNMIVMDELALEQAKLDELAQKYAVTLDVNAFNADDLTLF